MTENLVPNKVARAEVPDKVKDLLAQLNQATLKSPYTLYALQCLSTALLQSPQSSELGSSEQLTEQLAIAVADPLGSLGVQAIYRGGSVASNSTALGEVKFVPEPLLAVLNSATPNVAQWHALIT